MNVAGQNVACTPSTFHLLRVYTIRKWTNDSNTDTYAIIKTNTERLRTENKLPSIQRLAAQV